MLAGFVNSMFTKKSWFETQNFLNCPSLNYMIFVIGRNRGSLQMVNINLRPWYKHNLEHHIAYLPSSQHVQGSFLQNKKCISTKSHQNLTTNCIQLYTILYQLWMTKMQTNCTTTLGKVNTPIYSLSLEGKKVQAFCLLQISLSGIRTT